MGLPKQGVIFYLDSLGGVRHHGIVLVYLTELSSRTWALGNKCWEPRHMMSPNKRESHWMRLASVAYLVHYDASGDAKAH